MSKKRIYNQQALFGPLYAYLVVLSPPVWIKDDISGFKKELDAISPIGARNLHSIAHITLTDKLTDDADFHKTVGKLLEEQHAFTIRLNGFDVFDHGKRKTLFAAVETQEPILNLMRQLKVLSGHAHLSLVKNISHENAAPLESYLRQKQYDATWQCNEVIVLRKLMSEKEKGFRERFVIPLRDNSES
jgi:2'-5' RNA ligase